MLQKDALFKENLFSRFIAIWKDIIISIDFQLFMQRKQKEFSVIFTAFNLYPRMN